jgi:hypothetical protein
VALAAAVEAQVSRSDSEKQANRLRRIRRLIAQSAGKKIRDRILVLESAKADTLLRDALEGRYGIAEAVDRFLRLLG